MPRRFGPFGGAFVPETLVPALSELDRAWRSARRDPAFRQELSERSRNFGGRPTPLYFAENLTRHVGGAQIWLKREDLVHGGAHKFNNALGQGLLTKRMGKPRLIAETGAGQHGVATAMIGAALGLSTEVYMGSRDMVRQRPNVDRMELLGATVHPVTSGSRTLKDAINEALRDWITNVRTTHYLLGSAVGPHPFPTIVQELQSVIGKEIRRQSLRQMGRLPDTRRGVRRGREQCDRDVPSAPVDEDRAPRCRGRWPPAASDRSGVADARASGDSPRCLHVHPAGCRRSGPRDGQYLRGIGLCGRWPRALLPQGIRAGPVHLRAGPGGARCLRAPRTEGGVLPALEPSHALHAAMVEARKRPPSQRIVVTLSGRGDKDLGVVLAARRAR